jgi:intergrase/recombinase
MAMSAEKINKDLIMYKRKLDEVKSKTASKKEHLRQLQDKYNEVAKDQNGGNLNQSGSGMLDDDHPQMRTIRVMENRLDKAMIKYNEAMSIKKAYELIVKRLREERIGYDNQLSAIEQSLKGKESDFQELIILSQDASYAKDQAEKELNSYELQLSRMNAE